MFEFFSFSVIFQQKIKRNTNWIRKIWTKKKMHSIYSFICCYFLCHRLTASDPYFILNVTEWLKSCFKCVLENLIVKLLSIFWTLNSVLFDVTVDLDNMGQKHDEFRHTMHLFWSKMWFDQILDMKLSPQKSPVKI